jgi:hypothetical protein
VTAARLLGDAGVVLRDPIWGAVGSIATALAFILAFYAIIADRRKRDSEMRSSQARRVSAWIAAYGDWVPTGDALTTAILMNASDEPVYRVIARMVEHATGSESAQGEQEMTPRGPKRYPAALLVLPPGRYRTTMPPWDPGMRRPAAEIAFTDAAGRHWIRRQTGRLDEIKTEPVDHYGLGDRVSWQVPEPVSE